MVVKQANYGKAQIPGVKALSKAELHGRGWGVDLAGDLGVGSM